MSEKPRMSDDEIWSAVNTILTSKHGISMLKANTKKEMGIIMSAIPLHKSLNLSDDDVFAVLIAAAKNIPQSAMFSICALAMLELYNRDNPCKTQR